MTKHIPALAAGTATAFQQWLLLTLSLQRMPVEKADCCCDGRAAAAGVIQAAAVA